MRILVVGNEEVTSAMLRRALSAMGQEVAVAGDGEGLPVLNRVHDLARL